jgi:lipopolysaccharide biosynthesis glycosyltransferase
MSSDRDPVVVLAADENFAMPLAVTVRSVLDNLAPDRILRIFVLDGGLSDTSKVRLEQSWPDGRYHVEWIHVDSSKVADLPISGANHVNHTVYYRILMPWLLKDVERAIHLDADMLLRTDLGRLWDQGLAGHLCLAVQDCAAPFMDARATLANFDRCRRHIGCATPVPNFRELGLKPQAPYFNAGLLFVDLAGWRKADLPSQLLKCLRDNRPHVYWNDQYALNVVLSGRWGQLDLRWNQGSHIFGYPTWSQSPFDRKVYEQLRDDPYTIHFTTRHKPWMLSCHHPLRKQFFESVDRTAWAGWRPSPFTHPRAILDLLQAQRRRVRRARRQLQCRTIDWVLQFRQADTR